MMLILDAHLDLAWNAISWGRDLTRPLEEINGCEAGMTDDDARGHATTCLPELRRAGVAVCLATIQARTKPEVRLPDGASRMSLDYSHPEITYAAGQAQLAYYRLLEERGEVRMLHTAADLADHWRQWQAGPPDRLPVGIILAMEGADPIIAPAQAEAWFQQGLRTVSLAHYGMSRYAAGTSASGGLTREGTSLLAECERLGMILDVTHLSDEAFGEALDRFPGPVMASHNNCRALVPAQRQFSDEQIRRLLGRGGIIGVAVDAWMLYPDWTIDRVPRGAVTQEAVVDHVDHICRLAGDCRHVGVGSDLDGGYGSEQTPHGLDSIADLQKLGAVMARRGYSDAEIERIFHGNWLEFFMRHLPQ
jgi:membrane dipeptidase